MHPATFAQPYTKKGAFYNSVKASILKHYPVLKSFKECLGSTSSRKHDVQQAAAARKRQFRYEECVGPQPGGALRMNTRIEN
jgi:hypothetical protein